MRKMQVHAGKCNLRAATARGLALSVLAPSRATRMRGIDAHEATAPLLPECQNAQRAVSRRHQHAPPLERAARTLVELMWRETQTSTSGLHTDIHTHAQQYLPRFRVPKVDRCLFSRDDPLVIRDEMLPQSHGRYWRRVFLHGRCCYLRVLHGDINIIEHRSSAAICCGEYVLVVLCSSNIDRVFLPARWLAPLSFASLTVSVCALTRAVCRV